MTAKKQEIGSGLILFVEDVAAGTPDSTERLDIASGPCILLGIYTINSHSNAEYLWVADTSSTFAISGSSEAEEEVLKLKLPAVSENSGHSYTPLGVGGKGHSFETGLSFKLSGDSDGSANTGNVVTVGLYIKEFDSAA